VKPYLQASGAVPPGPAKVTPVASHKEQVQAVDGLVGKQISRCLEGLGAKPDRYWIAAMRSRNLTTYGPGCI